MESSLIFRAVKLLGLLTIDKQFATVLTSVPVNENLKNLYLPVIEFKLIPYIWFLSQLKKQIEDNVVGWLDIIQVAPQCFQLYLPYETNL